MKAKQTPGVASQRVQSCSRDTYSGKFDQVCLSHPAGGLWQGQGENQIPWLRAVLELGGMLIQDFELKCSRFQAGEFSTPFSHVEHKECLEVQLGALLLPAMQFLSLSHSFRSSSQSRASPKGSSLLGAKCCHSK